MGSVVRFCWRATRGARFWPWRSPYLRWRIETYTGQPAETAGLSAMLAFACGHPRRLLRFFAWCQEMGRWRRLSRHPALSPFAGPENDH